MQIKTIQINKNKKFLPVRKLSHNKTSHKTFLYSSNDIDYFIGVDLETEDIYLVPIEISSKYTSAIGINSMQMYKNNYNILERYIRNDINEEDNIGELLTDNADDNTEGMI